MEPVFDLRHELTRPVIMLAGERTIGARQEFVVEQISTEHRTERFSRIFLPIDRSNVTR